MQLTEGTSEEVMLPLSGSLSLPSYSITWHSKKLPVNKCKLASLFYETGSAKPLRPLLVIYWNLKKVKDTCQKKRKRKRKQKYIMNLAIALFQGNISSLPDNHDYLSWIFSATFDSNKLWWWLSKMRPFIVDYILQDIGIMVSMKKGCAAIGIMIFWLLSDCRFSYPEQLSWICRFVEFQHFFCESSSIFRRKGNTKKIRCAVSSQLS